MLSRFVAFAWTVRRVATPLVASIAIALPTPLPAQDRGAPALAPLVDGLGVSARVLVVAAHPDDEDTQLIAWLARARHIETAYLSLTRGDGGQNIIGNELGEALGAIRTEELLAARRLDGGRQYFTRAFDFGFSKNADETFTQWPRDSILRDVVTVVRQFRPHVIVAVFSGTPADGHGHHQASGILARVAYDVSGDTLRFPPAATGGFGPWTVSKFYRSANFRMQERATLRINVGAFDPVLGRSYNEIAAESRSQHRSQAMGSLQLKGPRVDLLVREASRARAPDDARLERGLLDGIDTTWARFRPLLASPRQLEALDALPSAFLAARQALDLRRPGEALPALALVARLLNQSCASPNDPVRSCPAPVARRDAVHGDLAADLAMTWAIARERVERALAEAAGIAVEATAPRELWAEGDSIPITVRVYNRGDRPVTLASIAVDAARAEAPAATILAPDSVVTDTLAVRLTGATQPWWLATPRAGAVFTARVTGAAESRLPTAATAVVQLQVAGHDTRLTVPVVYRYADPIRGERRHPVAVAPAITITLDDAVAYARANTPFERAVRLYVRSHASAARDVTVRLTLPAGLVADSAERVVSFPAAPAAATISGPGAAFGIGGAQVPERVRVVTFIVRGRLNPGRHQLAAEATSAGVRYATGYSTVAYEHVRPQRLYRPATLGIEAVDVTIPRGLTIAYIPGVGDNVAPMLEQLGIAVTVVEPAALPRIELSRFGAVVVGTRAYEASDALLANNARLLDYARAGGTLVVQYGQYEMTQPGVMPFPITLGRPADRVTVEGAPVTILDPAASILTTPNAISARDFDGWIQDRSLYMPRTFDSAYRAALELNDPGEPPNRGALLVAPLGRGTYVYTSLAFFRQLPNAVPGAARLFVNLLSARSATVP